jgi:hypothetical protein
VNIALQKGWLNQFPDLGVSALFIIPLLIFVYLALTHETVRQHHHLVLEYRLMTLLLFIFTGAVIGTFAWYAVFKLPLQQPRKAGQVATKTPETTLEVKATAQDQRGPKMVIALTMINQEKDLTASADGATIAIFNDSASVLKEINEVLRFPKLESAEVEDKYKSRARIAGGGKPGSDYMVVEVPELQPQEHVDLHVVFAKKQKVTSIDSWASQYAYAKDYIQVQQGFLGPEHRVEPQVSATISTSPLERPTEAEQNPPP